MIYLDLLYWIELVDFNLNISSIKPLLLKFILLNCLFYVIINESISLSLLLYWLWLLLIEDIFEDDNNNFNYYLVGILS